MSIYNEPYLARQYYTQMFFGHEPYLATKNCFQKFFLAYCFLKLKSVNGLATHKTLLWWRLGVQKYSMCDVFGEEYLCLLKR